MEDEVDLELIQNELANEALARAKSPVVLWRRSVKVRAASDVPERLLSHFIGGAGPPASREELCHEIDVLLGLDSISPHLSNSVAPSPHAGAPSAFANRARGQAAAAAAGRGGDLGSGSPASPPKSKSPQRPSPREETTGRDSVGSDAVAAGSPSPSRLKREGSELRLPPISPLTSIRGAPAFPGSPDGSSPSPRKDKWKTVCNGPGYSKSPRSRYGAWYIPPGEWHAQERKGGRSGDAEWNGHKGYGGDAAWIAKYELDLQRQMKDLYSSKVYKRYIQGRGEKLPHYLSAPPKAVGA